MYLWNSPDLGMTWALTESQIEPQLPLPFLSEGDPAMINQNHLILLSVRKREDTVGEGIILV